MSATDLPANWPRDIEASATECYERVMKTLIANTEAVARIDADTWADEWADGIGQAIILAFRIGIAWRDRYPDEAVSL